MLRLTSLYFAYDLALVLTLEEPPCGNVDRPLLLLYCYYYHYHGNLTYLKSQNGCQFYISIVAYIVSPSTDPKCISKKVRVF